jgi:RNA polymerase sigma-70 factor (ECF subfamily)
MGDIEDKNSNPDMDENREIIQRAIQELAPKFRSVIVLRLIDGYSTEETAKILKVPIGTVLSRLARAQKKLKEILSPMLELNHG